MKLNESFVKRLMTLAGNADYSSRFITEAKKKTAKKEKGASYRDWETVSVLGMA